MADIGLLLPHSYSRIMNWSALLGVALFGGGLWLGLATGTMPAFGAWNPNREEERAWFWMAGTTHAALLLLFTAVFLGLIP
jgi:hypothetical protein